MTDQSIQRRLAAIVVADVVGYSRLMEADEVATLANLRELRSGVIEPAVMRHNGRIFKVVGDGFLIEFGSAVTRWKQRWKCNGPPLLLSLPEIDACFYV